MNLKTALRLTHFVLGVGLLGFSQLAFAANFFPSVPRIKVEKFKHTALAKSTFLTLNNPVIDSADTLKARVYYSATDSTRFSKDKSIVTLYGAATLAYGNFNLKANTIVYNNLTHKGSAKNFTLYDKKNQMSTKGTYVEFDLKAYK